MSDSTAPSSTPARAVFSDEATRISSPPSSPPGFPWEQNDEPRDEKPISPLRPAKNAFSILGKRKPLQTVEENARSLKRQKSGQKDNSGLTQMQMSLGQQVQKKCQQCGMSYVASSAEDRKLHDKFHKQNTEGYDVGRDFVAKTDFPRNHLFNGVKEGDAIVVVDCLQKFHRKKRGQAILEIVQRELGAVPIPEADIWDVKEQSDFDVVDNLAEPRYKAYLYVRGTKCVGFLLVERIKEAWKVLRPQGAATKMEPEDQDTPKNAVEALRAKRRLLDEAQEAAKLEITEASKHPIRLTETKQAAVMGISRIWTSPTHRGEGIAIKLLDTAISHHNMRQSREVEEDRKALAARPVKETEYIRSLWGRLQRISSKDQVAFSQPTDAGARLARKWFGKAYGWSVYTD